MWCILFLWAGSFFPSAIGATVAVFDDPRYVDLTSGGVSAEAINLQASLHSFGLTVSTFTNFLDATNPAVPLFVPELENGDLASGLDAASKAALRDRVAGGGFLVVFGSNLSANRCARLLNAVFGFTIAPDTNAIGWNFAQTAGVIGTDFTNAPAVLPGPNATRAFSIPSLPADTRSLYAASNWTALAWIPFEKGRILYLGWDWYNAAPVGTQDGSWLNVLAQTVAEAVEARPPVLWKQPQSQSADPGATVVFSADAYGPAPFTYQWFQNGSAIGSDTNRLVLNSATPALNGNYWVVVNNAYGATTSQVARLSVLPRPPLILISPASQTVHDGDTVLMAVTATGTPPLSYQWYYNDHPLLGVTGTNFLLSPASLSDGGRYRVVVTNSAGVVTSQVAVLTVLPAPPTLLASPASQTVYDGALAGFNVSATGTPPLVYRWLRNGMTLPGEEEATLVFNPVTMELAGNYQAVVLNTWGSVTSKAATLTVLPVLPSILQQPSGQAVLEGDPAIFQVRSVGTGPLAYQWFFGAARVTAATNAVLVLPQAGAADAGSYSVMVSNAAGAVGSRSAWLFVSPRRQQPDIVWASGGHVGAVNAVAFSPDGRWLASCADDTTVKLWDTITGQLIRTLEGHTDEASALAISPDGTRLVSGSRDGALVLWNPTNGAKLTQLGPEPGVRAVAFSPNGRFIAAGGGLDSQPGNISLWSAADGGWQTDLSGHTLPVQALAFSPDGATLVSGGLDGRMIFWSPATGSELRTTNIGAGLYSLAWAPSGSSVLAGLDDHSVQLWNPTSLARLQVFPGHADVVQSVAFTSDGTTAISGSRDSRIILWHVPDGAALATFTNLAPVLAVASAPLAPWVAFGDGTGHVNRWATTNLNAATVLSFTENDASPVSVAFSADSRWMASGFSNDLVKIWRVADHFLAGTLTGGQNAVIFSPDGSLLAAGSADRSVRVWRWADGSVRRTFTGHTQPVLALRFTGDGSQVASASLDDTVRLWRMPDGGSATVADLRPFEILSAAFSPDGTLVALATVLSNGPAVQVRQTSDGTLLPLANAGFFGASLQFSSDGHRLTATDGAWWFKQWNVADGRLLIQFSTNQGGVFSPSMGLSPDGLYAAMAAWLGSGTLSLLRTSDGTPVASYSQEAFSPRSGWSPLAFSPDGRLFGYGRYDGTLIVARHPFGAVRFTGWQTAAGKVITTWEGGSGRYQWQQTTNLVAPVWVDWGSPTSATAATNFPAGPAGFGRLKAL